MRENIGLYRGKRTDNGEWIEGSLLKVTISGKPYWLIFSDDFVQFSAEIKAMQHACVDPDTVGQYVGKTDKNGEKIFEWSLIEYDSRVFVVKYFDDFAEFIASPADGKDLFLLINSDTVTRMTVVGNLFDDLEPLQFI